MALTRVSGNLLTSTAVTAGIYGGSGNTVSLTVDAQGRVTAAANVASSGGGITYTTVKTANYTAVADDGVQTNTTAGAFTVTLPATPANGDQVFVVDSFNTWGTNNLTIGRNGSTIEGVAQDLVCDITGVSVQCVYNGTTWDIFAQVGGAGGASQWTTTGSDIYYTTGNVGINTSSPAYKLQVAGSGEIVSVTTGNTFGLGYLSFRNSVGTRLSYVGPAGGGSSDFFVANEANAAIIFYTNNTERLSIPSDSAGIKFPATQAASTNANTLDDYEEGTWTPSFSSTSNLSGTPSISNATYTKTGNRVIWQFQASGYSATSSATQTYFICTFPFTQANIVPGAVIHAPASGATGSMQANDTSSGYFVWAATSSPTSGSVGTLYAFGQSQTT